TQSTGKYKTNGIGIPFGVSFLIADFIVVDVGAFFHPAVSVWSDSTANILSGLHYTYKERVDALPVGLTPRISIGVAF
ncbi:MAG: hypothetical protein IK031_00760, partial [Bacteroidales bacterium]|nr:hypothetical protein [Bacteroidales bacterium]